jgi:hypothetical protein
VSAFFTLEQLADFGNFKLRRGGVIHDFNIVYVAGVMRESIFSDWS